eukprot:1159673-Pelagomonas_calceolata.AAC.9
MEMHTSFFLQPLHPREQDFEPEGQPFSWQRRRWSSAARPDDDSGFSETLLFGKGASPAAELDAVFIKSVAWVPLIQSICVLNASAFSPPLHLVRRCCTPTEKDQDSKTVYHSSMTMRRWGALKTMSFWSLPPLGETSGGDGSSGSAAASGERAKVFKHCILCTLHGWAHQVNAMTLCTHSGRGIMLLTLVEMRPAATQSIRAKLTLLLVPTRPCTQC